MGCKRVLFTSTWYPALRRPDVDLVTDPVVRVTPSGVVTRGAGDGAGEREHPCDVLVLSTGFAATEILVPLQVTGRDGADLHTVWADGARAHLGMTVPRFPNIVVLYGPNTGHGTGSAIDMLEAQAGYIGQALSLLVRGGAERLEVRPAVYEAFQRELGERMRRHRLGLGLRQLVRQRPRAGHGTWPAPPAEYVRRTATLNVADYETRVVAEPVAAP